MQKEKKIKVRFLGTVKSFFIFEGTSILIEPSQILEICEQDKKFYQNQNWELVKNGD